MLTQFLWTLTLQLSTSQYITVIVLSLPTPDITAVWRSIPFFLHFEHAYKATTQQNIFAKKKIGHIYANILSISNTMLPSNFHWVFWKYLRKFDKSGLKLTKWTPKMVSMKHHRHQIVNACSVLEELLLWMFDLWLWIRTKNPEKIKTMLVLN